MAMLKQILSLPLFQTLKFQRSSIINTGASCSPKQYYYSADQSHHHIFLFKQQISCSSSRSHNSSKSSSISSVSSSSSSSVVHDSLQAAARKMVEEFNPKIPIEEAPTPPTSWYTDPSFLSLEFHRVFYRGWQVVGFTEQIKNPNDFFTGRLGSVQFVICRDANGKLHAFHNVCRHRASLLASGCGQHQSCFVCPYHGWTYGLDGVLLTATRISGIQNFNINEFGLVPIQVATWGPFILINLDEADIQSVVVSQDDQEIDSKMMVANEWLGNCSEILSTNSIDSSLSFVCRREYAIKSNWKVFCDNFLDGGYHVPYAHKSFASGFNLDTYTVTIYDKVSIQECECAPKEKEGALSRIGSKASYAFVFPNYIINRYGPWMETNLVLPQGPNQCQVISDYFLEPSLLDDKAFINKSIDESEAVQMEDIALCEGVQRGLESPSDSSGRYVPTVEKAVHHFHCLLHQNLLN